MKPTAKAKFRYMLQVMIGFNAVWLPLMIFRPYYQPYVNQLVHYWVYGH